MPCTTFKNVINMSQHIRPRTPCTLPLPVRSAVNDIPLESAVSTQTHRQLDTILLLKQSQHDGLYCLAV